MQSRPQVIRPGKTWLSWCCPATPLRQPRDKNRPSFVRHFALQRAHHHPTHHSLAKVTPFLFASQLSFTRSFIAAQLHSIVPSTKAIPKFASSPETSGSVYHRGKPIVISRESRRGSLQRASCQRKAQRNGEAKPTTWELEIARACN
jgi:hypothetical protein